MKRYEEAIASYDKAVQFKPDYREAIEARNQAQSQLDSEKLQGDENKEELRKPND